MNGTRKKDGEDRMLELVPLHALGGLDNADRAEFEAHARECAVCGEDGGFCGLHLQLRDRETEADIIAAGMPL